MNVKKIIALAMLGLGLVFMFVTVVSLGFSAAFVNAVEDETDGLVKLNGGDVKEIIAFFQMAYEADDDKVNVFDVVEYDLGMYDYGFHTFCLYARGWFFAIGILFIAASVVLMAVAHEPGLIGMTGNLFKTFGTSLVASVAAIFAAIKNASSAPKAPKAKKGATGSCPACGASYTLGTLFCASCGNKLPDPALVGVCFSCGVRNDPTARFCANCGKPLQEEKPAVEAAPAEPVAPVAANEAAVDTENTQQ